MKLIYNESIYNEWNAIQLIKTYQAKVTLLTTCAEYFRVPIKFDNTGKLVPGTGTNLSSVFKIHYDELMKFIYILVTEMHFTYNDFNIMPWFEVTKLIDIHKDRIEEQNKHQEGEQSKMEQQISQMHKQYNTNNYNVPKYDPPKMPSMPNLNNMPKF